MPEGPEVRRYADQIGKVLIGQPIAAFTARTRLARQWLQTHPTELIGRTVLDVRSHGKNLIGWIDGGYYFYSHLMMWGSWQTFAGEPPVAIDRRERARIVVPTGGVMLFSAPIFELGQGDPYLKIELLGQLGVDILPYGGAIEFAAAAFQQRLLQPENLERAIGAVLLDQQLIAGIGNYLRAEILFECRLNPWRRVQELTPAEIANLGTVIPHLARRAYETGGVTVPPPLQARMQQDPTLVYRSGSEYGARHYVFRRTNLPCLVCSTPIRQQRQTVWADESSEKSRIIYFCPACQTVPIATKSAKPRSRSATQAAATRIPENEAQ
jgi:endonuclease VIII